MAAGRPFTKAAVKQRDRNYAYRTISAYISYLVTEDDQGTQLPVEGDEILWLSDNGYTFECKDQTIWALPPSTKLEPQNIKMAFYSDRGLGSESTKTTQNIEGAKNARATKLMQLLSLSIFSGCLTLAKEKRSEEPSFERQFFKICPLVCLPMLETK